MAVNDSSCNSMIKVRRVGTLADFIQYDPRQFDYKIQGDFSAVLKGPPWRAALGRRFLGGSINQNWASSVDPSRASTELSPPVTQFMTRSK